MNYATAALFLAPIFSPASMREEPHPRRISLLELLSKTLPLATETQKIDESFLIEHRRRQCLNEVQELRALQKNWDSYGAERPSEQAIRNAFRAVLTLHEADLLPNRIRATSDESIVFELRDNGNKHLLEFYGDGDIVLLERRGANEVARDVTLDDLGKTLADLRHG